MDVVLTGDDYGPIDKTRSFTWKARFTCVTAISCTPNG